MGLLSFYFAFKRKRNSYQSFLVLNYHCFLPKGSEQRRYIQPGMVTTPEIFDEQLSFLKRNFAVMPLETLAQALKSGSDIPRNALALTVDDGWRDNYVFAFPIIKKHGIPVTIFITADYIGGVKAFWFYRAKYIIVKGGLSRIQLEKYLERFGAGKISESSWRSMASEYIAGDNDPADWFMGRLKGFKAEIIDSLLAKIAIDAEIPEYELSGKNLMLSWDEIREMARAGVEIGSHGCSHRILTTLTREEIEHELIDSRKKIQENLDIRVKGFCYPNGDFDATIMEMVSAADYSYAVGVHGKDKSRIRGMKSIGGEVYAIRRTSIHDNAIMSPFGKFSAALFYYHLIKNI